VDGSPESLVLSSHDQRADLERQVARLSEWAAKTGQPVVHIEAEVGSGMNGSRPKLRRLLADPRVSTVVVEHRDRLARTNAELVEAALSAHGRRLVVIDEGDVDDDLVRDMTEVLTRFCARLYGRRSARNRAEKALRCAEQDVGSQGRGQAGTVRRSVTAAERDGLVSRRLQEIAPPFVVDSPGLVCGPGCGSPSTTQPCSWRSARISERSPAAMKRCAEGRLAAKEKADSGRERKRALTAASSSRWAGAITRTSEDAFGLALRNLGAERRSLGARIATIERRLAIPVGERPGRLRGYATGAERFEKQRCLQALRHRLAAVEAGIEACGMSICRGGKALARATTSTMPA
jgi:putative resolvase